MIQTLSLKLSQYLSSLAPGFKGHSVYVTKNGGGLYVVCRNSIEPYDLTMIICPAWQVEDLLRNWSKIVAAVKKNPLPEDHINKYGRGTDVIVLTLIQEGDTAYQKIEEYLWTILKQPKGEECTKAHCKCIQTGCLNHHYVDDK